MAVQFPNQLGLWGTFVGGDGDEMKETMSTTWKLRFKAQVRDVLTNSFKENKTEFNLQSLDEMGGNP